MEVVFLPHRAISYYKDLQRRAGIDFSSVSKGLERGLLLLKLEVNLVDWLRYYD
jgi:hypothetical protein